jgi:hypothetical protein
MSAAPERNHRRFRRVTGRGAIPFSGQDQNGRIDLYVAELSVSCRTCDGSVKLSRMLT